MASRPKGLEIVETGVEGLDRLLAGGFPRGALVLLAGNPGTGKTTLAAKLLYEAARRRREPVMYVSFVETRDDFVRQMHTLGMDFEELEEQGLFHYNEALTVIGEEGLLAQMEDLLKRVMELNIRMIALDSVSAMLQMVQDRSKVREIMQNFFVNGVKPLGVISLLIAEHPYGARTVGYGIEEFIVDAVIILRFEIESGKIRRILEIRKARWAPIRQAEVPFYIRPGTVFEVSLPEELSHVPPLDISKFYDLGLVFDSLARGGIVEKTKLSPARPGSPVLALPRGAQAFVGVAIPLNTRLLAGILAAGFLKAYPGLRLGVVTFKSSPRSIRGITTCALAAIGCKDSLRRAEQQLRVLSLNPTAYTVDELYNSIRFFTDETRPDVLVFEGIELLDFFHPRQELVSTLYNLMLRNKKNKITSIYLYAARSREELLENPMSEVADLGGYASSLPQLAPHENGYRQHVILEVFGNLGHTSVEAYLNISRLMDLRCIG